MSRQTAWMSMLSTILWETVERFPYQFITFRSLPNFFCYRQDVMHQLGWSMRRLEGSLFLCCLEGRRMDIPHIYTFVFTSRIYACHGRRYVIKGRFGFGDGRSFISREDTNLLPGLVYARLCIYGVR